jgi:hypothetical protein
VVDQLRFIRDRAVSLRESLQRRGTGTTDSLRIAVVCAREGGRCLEEVLLLTA